MRSLFEHETRSLRPLRPKQETAIASVRAAIKEGHRRIILQAPCGFGKTLTAAHIISGALRKGNRPLFTCPAITLVEQTLKAFEAEGLHDIGVLQADHVRTDRRASLQIASVQTLVRRDSPDSDFAIIDEAHEEFSGLYAMLGTDAWKDRIVIGLTATPWAKGMGLRWTKLIIAATINEMIADGFATPTVVYGPAADVNREDIKITAGEFDEAQSAEAMSTATVIGDVIEEWKAKSPREKTFMFCVNRKHAQAQMHAFTDCGVPFGYIDANTPMGNPFNPEPGTRLRAFMQMQAGEIAGISSVGCLIRGVDEDVRCIVDLQMTNSEMRHVQKWGRGVRTAPGKSHLIGLDHAGNNLDLGLFADIHHEALDTRKKEERGEAYKGDNKAAKPRKCPKCHQVVPPIRRTCAACGAQMPLLPTGVREINGRLVEVGANFTAEQKARQSWYSQMVWIANDRGFKPGWASQRYREKFGAWPDGLVRVAKKPSDEVRKEERHRYAEYRKAQAQPATDEYRGEF